jgi:8-oxo-dGTP pyrophosphatase MutT (NUDIX family)
MEPMMNESDKRKAAALIAYRPNGKEYEFYLQKRTADAPTNPGKFGLFGGGFEQNESAIDALFREIQEELVYTPRNLTYFSRYETATRIFDVFIEEVGPDFESLVDVQEGDFGTFMTLVDIEKADNISPITRIITQQLSDELKKK